MYKQIDIWTDRQTFLGQYHLRYYFARTFEKSFHTFFDGTFQVFFFLNSDDRKRTCAKGATDHIYESIFPLEKVGKTTSGVGQDFT